MGMQYHLKGRGFSGRVVRCRELDPTEVEDNLTAAAKLASKDATIIELKKTEWRNGVKRMITEVSDPTDDPMKKDLKFRKLSPQQLDEQWASLFKAKDVLLLESVYRDYHEVIPSEVADITGKAVPLSEG